MGALLDFKAPGHGQAPVRLVPTVLALSACVLDSATVTRLAQLNTAVRRLRALGYRVVDQSLSTAQGGQPMVQIDQGSEQVIQPLLAITGWPTVHQTAEGRWGRVVLDGVVVTWECARQGEAQR